jgi:hypothetical protein
LFSHIKTTAKLQSFSGPNPKTHAHRERQRKRERYLSLEVMLVLEDGVVVSVHADSVREHLLLVVQKRIGAEILREIHAFVHHRGALLPACDALLPACDALLPARDAVLVAPHYTTLRVERETERGFDF